MKSSPHRPLILKRRKLSLPHTEAFNTLVRNESDGQTAGSSKQEQARTDEPVINGKEPAIQEVSTRIRIIDHPTLSNAQVVAVPTNTDIQSILEAMRAKGKESGSNEPNKFIFISSGSRSSSMKSRAFQNLFKSEDEHIITNSRAQKEVTCIGQSSGRMEKSTFSTSELLSTGGREQGGNSNGETPSCGLDNSLTNIQWLGKMSSDELNPCSVKKEAEKENQTPKQKAMKFEEGSAPSSSTTSWQEPFSERPPYSYMAMIQFAINSTEKKRMMLKDIYTWIEDHFPYFKHVAKPGWKNSIRHNLSLHEMFVRETSANGKISFWTIHPEANRYLTLDQVFKQQKRHSLDLQKDMGGSCGSKSEPQTARWKMKPLLPRVNSYLVPIQFPVSQSLILQSSSKVPLPIAKSASENMQSSKRVRIAPKVLPSGEEPMLFPAAVSVKEETYYDEEPCPFATHQSIKEDACQISRESFPAALCIKEERDNFHSHQLSSSFLPALPVKEEPAQSGEVLNLRFPAAPVKQKRQFMALKSPPQSLLDMLVIKRQEEHKMGRSRRKQHLALPCSEEPVLLLPGSCSPDSFILRHDLPFEQEIPPQGNMSYFRCFQEEGGPFKTPMKEMFCKLPISSTPSSKASVATPTFLGCTDPWRLAPFVKETSNPDFSPVRTPPLPLLSLQENLDLLGFSSTPLSAIPLCDSPQLPLLNAEANDMVSGPLTSSPAPSKQSSPELWASVLPEKHSLLEGLVLDTMNDSLSKILLDISFSGPEDDVGTDFSWSQLIPELK
ncbi:forkhead box protein M1 [Elgaria multicarinata webbii]|uniref:forkhead box protein M1 n=1 Tax=Elgaria multicarinata webbii TaxID=159646 RepID=UPI002FCD5CBB